MSRKPLVFHTPPRDILTRDFGPLPHERKYRAGFEHAAYAVLEALRNGARLDDFTAWAEAVTAWRYDKATVGEFVVPPRPVRGSRE